MSDMTDEELRQFINCTPEEFAIIRPKLSAGEIKMFNAMRNLENDLTLWQEGLGPKPKNAIICGCKEVKHGGGNEG